MLHGPRGHAAAVSRAIPGASAHRDRLARDSQWGRPTLSTARRLPMFPSKNARRSVILFAALAGACDSGPPEVTQTNSPDVHKLAPVRYQRTIRPTLYSSELSTSSGTTCEEWTTDVSTSD